MKQLTEILITRLEKKGMNPEVIPCFIRNLENTILTKPHTGFLQVNNHLHSLGWDDFELDYRTLELATECFETNGLRDLENNLSH